MDEVVSFLIGIFGVFVGSIITYYINKKILERQEKIRIFGEINKKMTIFFDNFSKLMSRKKGRSHFEKDEKNSTIMALKDLMMEIVNYVYFLDDATSNYLAEKMKDILEILQKDDFKQEDITKILEELTVFMRKKLK